MTNPRDAIDFTGIAAQYDTFEHDSSIVYSADEPGGSVSVDLAVKLVTDRQVALTTDASGVKGKLIRVEADGKCNVQTEGYMQLPSGSGAALTIGKKIVGDLDGATAGYIREVAASDAELAVARGEIVDNNDTAAVWVKL